MTVTITNVGEEEDLPTVSVTAEVASTSEGNSQPGRFKISRDSDEGSLTVNYTVSGSALPRDEGATVGGDYARLAGSVSFVDGQSEATIDVSAFPDAELETAETVVVNLTPDLSEYRLGTTSATVNINNNAPPVFREPGTTTPKTLWEFSYDGTSSTVGSLFATDPDMDALTFASPNASGPFRVRSTGEIYQASGVAIEYPHEYQFEATVSDGVNEPVSATVIVSTVSTGVWRLTAVNDAAGDVAAGASITVPVTANDTVSGGTGTAPGFRVTAVGTAEHGTVTFSDTSVTYTPNADYSGRDDFTYTVTLDGTSETSTATVVVNVTAEEGNEDNTPPRFVNDDNQTVTSYTFRYNDPAEELVGFVQAIDDDGDTLFFTSAATGPFRVGPNGRVYRVTTEDVIFPSNHTLNVTVDDGVNEPVAATVNIVVRDQVWISEAIPNAYERSEDGLPAAGRFRISRTNRIGTLTVNYSVKSESTASSNDYSSLSGSVTFVNDQTFTYVNVIPVPDGEEESDETVIIEIDESPAAYDILPSGRSTTITIHDTSAYEEELLEAINNEFSFGEMEQNADGAYIANVVLNDTVGGSYYVWNATSSIRVEDGLGPQHGTVTFTNSGEFEYVPNGEYAENDSFVYRITDAGLGQTSTAVVWLTLADLPKPILTGPFDGSVSRLAKKGALTGAKATVEEISTDIEFSIKAGNQGTMFRIDKRTGEISLDKDATSATQPIYTLTIGAKNKKTNKEADPATATIKILTAVGIIGRTDAIEGVANQNDFQLEFVRFFVGNKADQPELTVQFDTVFEQLVQGNASTKQQFSASMADLEDVPGRSDLDKLTAKQLTISAGEDRAILRFRAKDDGTGEAPEFFQVRLKPVAGDYVIAVTETEIDGTNVKANGGVISETDAHRKPVDRANCAIVEGFTLFANGTPGKPDPTEGLNGPAGNPGVHFNDIRQGVDNCFLMASLIAAARDNWQNITDLITDRGDGTYTVNFRSGPRTITPDFSRGANAVAFTVPPIVPNTPDSATPVSSDYKIATDNARQLEIWPLIVEQAFQTYAQYATSTSGGNAVDAYNNLTGRMPTRITPTFQLTTETSTLSPTLRTDLETARDNGKQVMFTMRNEARAGATDGNVFPEQDFISWHVYVVAWDVVDPEGKGRIALINPNDPNTRSYIEWNRIEQYVAEIAICPKRP